MKKKLCRLTGDVSRTALTALLSGTRAGSAVGPPCQRFTAVERNEKEKEVAINCVEMWFLGMCSKNI